MPCRTATRLLVERNGTRHLGFGLDLERNGEPQAPEKGERLGQQLQTELLARIEADVQLGGPAFFLQSLEQIEGSAQRPERAQDLALDADTISRQLGFRHQPAHPIAFTMRSDEFGACRVSSQVARSPRVLRLDAQRQGDLRW